MIRAPRHRAFTLAEAMIAMMASTIILGALLLSSTQLQRALYASETYAASQSRQHRLIDYLARDLRRAVGVATATTVNGSGGTPLLGTTATLENGLSLVLTLPAYYQTDDPGAANYDVPLPVVAEGNVVDYGNSRGHLPGIRVLFRKQYLPAEGCECIVRLEDDHQLVIVRNAENLRLQVGISGDGRTGTIEVAFTPSSRSPVARVTTHDEFLLRNLRID